ncbi:MAG: sensor histidine kinase, partial [Patescibacteria group bacterium]|nr:sensor histidine kinase [Patescibacteria group bacterium]
MPVKKKKFKSKVLAIFFLISFLPVLVIAAGNLYLVVKTRQQSIAELQNLAMENLSEKITKYLNQKSEGLNLVVSGDIESINDLPINNLYFLLFNSFNHSRPNSLEFIDENGFIIAKANGAYSFLYNENYLAKYSDDEILFQDNNGVFVKKTDLKIFSQIESNVSESPDYENAIFGKDYFGQLEFIDNVPAMRIATQIKNKDNKIIGAVSAEVSLAQANELIEDIVLGSEGYLYLIEKSGNVIASGNERVVKVGDNLLDIPRVSDFTDTKDNSIKFTRNLANKEAVFSGLHIKALDWYVFSEWPVKDAFGLIGNILYGSFFATIVILIFIIVIASYFTNKIVKPIKVLSGGAKEISEGNLDHEIVLKTGDEFEALGGQFNNMIKVLKDNRKLRDEFVFIAAHELRTPVTAIRGYLSMVLEDTFGKVPEKIKENLIIANKSNDRLVQLVQDLLEVARSEAGKMKIETKAVNIKERVNTVIKELKSLSLKKNIKINYFCEKDFIVLADEYKLSEVLVNIIGNAIKYTVDNGSIDINHEIKDGFLITNIKDHGIGMSEKQMKKLFTKF